MKQLRNHHAAIDIGNGYAPSAKNRFSQASTKFQNHQ